MRTPAQVDRDKHLEAQARARLTIGPIAREADPNNVGRQLLERLLEFLDHERARDREAVHTTARIDTPAGLVLLAEMHHTTALAARPDTIVIDLHGITRNKRPRHARIEIRLTHDPDAVIVERGALHRPSDLLEVLSLA